MTSAASKIIKSTIFLLLVLSFYSCYNDDYSSIKGATMGTTYSIKYSTSSLSSYQIQTEIDDILNLINRQMSTYINDSEISPQLQGAKYGAPYDTGYPKIPYLTQFTTAV